MSLIVVALTAMQAHAALFLWDAARDGQHVWLFGSIHLGRADFYPLPAPIEAAYSQAPTLAVEADVTRTDDMAQLAPMMALPPDQSLHQMLTPRQQRRLRLVLAHTGLSAANADRMKPWALWLALVTADMARLGLTGEMGVDVHYLKAAHAEGKPVLELESLRSQLSLLDQTPQPDALALLDMELAPVSSAAQRRQIDALVRGWQGGDAAVVRRLIDDESHGVMATKRLNNRLFGERNRLMVDKIIALAGTPAPLVIVGAGHLAGPDNLLDMLRARGFQVTQE